MASQDFSLARQKGQESAYVLRGMHFGLIGAEIGLTDV